LSAFFEACIRYLGAITTAVLRHYKKEGPSSKDGLHSCGDGALTRGSTIAAIDVLCTARLCRSVKDQQG
jgi:hypothetical protein